jgi:hypothetical protein
MEKSKQYIIDNMTELERILYLKTFNFVKYSTIVLMIITMVFALLKQDLVTHTLFGSITTLWVIYAIVWKQVDKRAVHLLRQGGFKLGHKEADTAIEKAKNKK